MKKLFLFLALLAAGVFYFWQSGSETESFDSKETLVIGDKIADLMTLDPAESYEFLGNELIHNLYQRLLTYDSVRPEHMIPDAALSYSISPDHKTVIFKIKEGQTFSSGNPLTAHDVAFSLKRVVTLDKAPAILFKPLGWTAENVEEKIRALNDFEIQISLNPDLDPEALLHIFATSTTAIVDQKEVMAKGASWLQKNSAGSGPFVLKKWVPQEMLILERRVPSPPLIQRIIFKSVKEVGNQELLLKKGDIDIARNIPLAILETIEGATPLIMDTSNLRILHLNQKNPHLQNPKVREAIRYAIDYQELVNHIKRGAYKMHQSFVPPQVPFSLTGQRIEKNVEKAKKLMQEAGIPEGFTISLTTVDKDLAQKIKDDLSKINITVDILLGDDKQVLTKIRTRGHELGIGLWSSLPFDVDANAVTFLFNPDNGDNPSDKTLAWRNMWVDKDLSQRAIAAKLIKDPKARTAEFVALQEAFLKDAPMIVLAQENRILGLRNTVKNLIPAPSVNALFYYNVSKTA